MLAGMYINTSSHIVAAPMAHYLALNSSRFLYSHDTCQLPVHGLDNIIKDRNMELSFRNIGGKQVPYHESMNYYFRSLKLSNTCFYEYFRDMEFMSYTTADQHGIDECDRYPFTEEHPCYIISLAVRRKRKCIPVFPWQWLGPTMNFSTTLLQSVMETDPDYHVKEEYAYKFMLLFLPFRSNQDLMLNGNYQLRWQQANNDGLFPDAMIAIANNIQNIHNSLNATNPPNAITMDTILEESVDLVQEEKSHTTCDDFLTNIAQFFLDTSSTDQPQLTEEITTIDPMFQKEIFRGAKYKFPENSEILNLNSVIQFDESAAMNSDSSEVVTFSSHFVSEYSMLNTLASQNLLIVNQEENQGQATENIGRNIVNATGTWESIVVWGKNAKLDTEQQTAFEILTATYVLTFYDEANSDDEQDCQEFILRKTGLCHLARRNIGSQIPLCLFVTGPAGSGKCKFIVRYTTNDKN
jgi:hypothetical protein